MLHHWHHQQHRYVRLEVVKQYNDAIKGVARESGVYFFDMEQEFGKEKKLYRDMVHYTGSGVQRFARLLVPVVLRIASNANN